MPSQPSNGPPTDADAQFYFLKGAPTPLKTRYNALLQAHLDDVKAGVAPRGESLSDAAYRLHQQAVAKENQRTPSIKRMTQALSEALLEFSIYHKDKKPHLVVMAVVSTGGLCPGEVDALSSMFSADRHPALDSLTFLAMNIRTDQILKPRRRAECEQVCMRAMLERFRTSAEGQEWCDWDALPKRPTVWRRLADRWFVGMA